jgi:superfamily II DNA/RNA helicase
MVKQIKPKDADLVVPKTRNVETISDKLLLKTSIKKTSTVGTFNSLGLSPQTLKGINKLGYKFPTPIQRKAIPVIMTGLSFSFNISKKDKIVLPWQELVPERQQHS